MPSLSGDRKWISVAPMVAAGFGSYNLLIYLPVEAPEGRSGTLEDSLEMPIKQGGQRAALDASASANSSMDARVQTQPELEILELVAQGWVTPRTATELAISPHSVRNHIRNRRHKLNATSKLGAVVTGIRTGLLPVTPH